jgi:hypothetical protein
VYTLLFIDSLVSTCCSFISVTIDLLAIYNVMGPILQNITQTNSNFLYSTVACSDLILNNTVTVSGSLNAYWFLNNNYRYCKNTQVPAP